MKNINWIYMFLIYKTSIKIMDGWKRTQKSQQVQGFCILEGMTVVKLFLLDHMVGKGGGQNQ
jgi:hypothetical protein